MSEEDILFKTLFSVLILAIVLGNSLVILVINRSRSKKAPLNYLLLNLAVADLTAAVFYVPPSILQGTFTYPEGLAGAVVCRLFASAYVTWTSLLSSVSCLVFIAVDRYYAIMNPFSTRHRITAKKVKVFIFISWTICAILAVPNIFFREFDEAKLVCQSKQSLITKTYIVLWLLAMGIVPTTIMMVLYGRVIYRLWLERNPNAATSQAVRRSRKKVTKTMLLISAIYVVCWFPDLVRHVLEVYSPSQFNYSTTSSNIFHSVNLINSAVNPVIYAFQFQQFRKGFLEIVSCGRRCRRIEVSGSNRTPQGEPVIESPA